jgi:CDP-diacylglycerol--glycerol-3-phosphate 3-phosphatidyltransferase
MLKTTANKITVLRVILIPVWLILAYRGYSVAALCVYIIACLSDLADGYIARHYNQITNFGKFMDPLADKMLVLAAMCFFVEKGRIPGWVVALVLFREFSVSGLRLIAVEQNRVIAAAWSGKIKTAVTMIALCFMTVVKIGWVDKLCSILILLTTVYSGVEYFIKNKDVFQDID